MVRDLLESLALLNSRIPPISSDSCSHVPVDFISEIFNLLDFKWGQKANLNIENVSPFIPRAVIVCSPYVYTWDVYNKKKFSSFSPSFSFSLIVAMCLLSNKRSNEPVFDVLLP